VFVQSSLAQAQDATIRPDALNPETMAKVVVAIRNMKAICSKYYKLNEKEFSAIELTYLNTGNFGGEAQFSALLNVAGKQIKKQITAYGESHWCKVRRTDYERVDPNLFR
jgi:hypothetical protein